MVTLKPASVTLSVTWLPTEASVERNARFEALDPPIRLFNTYVRLIRAQVPARLDRVVAEIPEKCEGERCLRLKLTVVGEAFFDVIDEEELDALDPSDEKDTERIEGLHKTHLFHHPAYCGAARPRVQAVLLGLAASTRFY